MHTISPANTLNIIYIYTILLPQLIQINTNHLTKRQILAKIRNCTQNMLFSNVYFNLLKFRQMQEYGNPINL